MSFQRLLRGLLIAAILTAQTLFTPAAQAAAFINCADQHEIPTAECAALVALLDSNAGSFWSATIPTWSLTSTPSHWEGVTVTGGHVTALALNNFDFYGFLPLELGNLTFLQSLDLRATHGTLFGGLPVSLTALTHLTSLQAEGTSLCEPQEAAWQAWKATVTTWSNLPPCYKVSGYVNDANGPLAGVSITAALFDLLEPIGVGAGQATSGADGFYALYLPPWPTPYAIQAHMPNRTFANPRIDIGIADANVAGQNFGVLPSFAGCDQVSEIPVLECAALLALQKSTGGPHWNGKFDPSITWLANAQISNWYGITITGGHVTAIGLSGTNLEGTLPTELGDLAYLTNLDLSNNPLSGRLPQTLTKLTRLTDLSFNQTAVCEPRDASFQSWRAGVPRLAPNPCITIRGHVYQTNGAPLPGATISSGKLRPPVTSGADGDYVIEDFSIYKAETIKISLPGRYFNPPNYSMVGIATDATKDFWVQPFFSGCAQQNEIPLSECDALSALYYSTNGVNWVDFHDNENYPVAWLVSNTPSQWNGVTVTGGHVTGLLLSGVTHLKGTLPTQLANLSELQSLILSNNQLMGSIPPQLGSLTKLSELDLSDNQLTGSIPPQLGSLTNLLKLKLNRNHLTGGVPSELGNLPQLMSLNLSRNHLDGDLPVSLLNLVTLTHWYSNQNLQLDNNRLNHPAATADLASFLNLHNPGWELSQHPGLIHGVIKGASGPLVVPIDLSLEDPSGQVASSCAALSGEYWFNVDFDISWKVQAAPAGDTSCGKPALYLPQYWANAAPFTLTSADPVHNAVNFSLTYISETLKIFLPFGSR